MVTNYDLKEEYLVTQNKLISAIYLTAMIQLYAIFYASLIIIVILSE